MNSMQPASNVKKIWDLLLPEERKNSLVLFVFMLIGVGLETLGVGLVIPRTISLYTKKFCKQISCPPANT